MTNHESQVIFPVTAVTIEYSHLINNQLLGSSVESSQHGARPGGLSAMGAVHCGSLVADLFSRGPQWMACHDK